MPDPHKDLADIIEPQITAVAATGNTWPLVGAAVLSGLIIIAGIYWYWRRGAPMRALRRLRELPDPQQAANTLATLIPKFKAPPEPGWLDALQRLRFGPPQDDARAILDMLCQQAKTLLQGHA